MRGRVMIIEDDAAILRAFGLILSKAGFEVTPAQHGDQAFELIDECDPEVIVCDYMLPGRNGIELLVDFRRLRPFVEFIVVTAFGSIDVIIEALRQGATDFLTKPIPKLELLENRVQQAVERHRLRIALSEAGERIRIANERLQTALAQARHRYVATARILGGVLDLHDRDQGSHAKRVAGFAVAVASSMDLDEETIRDIEVAGTLHDIGYLALPAHRARRSDATLREDELEIVRAHPVLGETLLSGLDGDGSVGGMVRHHHESWDGRGFPDGLGGGAIPIGARILAVCEAYDEHLTWPAPGTTTNSASARDLLRKGAGSRFDPDVVGHFLGDVVEQSPGVNDSTVVIGLAELEEAMVLAQPVYTKSGLLLLPRGQVLRQAHIDRIRNFHRVHPIADRIYILRDPE